MKRQIIVRIIVISLIVVTIGGTIFWFSPLGHFYRLATVPNRIADQIERETRYPDAELLGKAHRYGDGYFAGETYDRYVFVYRTPKSYSDVVSHYQAQFGAESKLTSSEIFDQPNMILTRQMDMMQVIRSEAPFELPLDEIVILIYDISPVQTPDELFELSLYSCFDECVNLEDGMLIVVRYPNYIP
ncbi:MAG: hypothetical protein AAF653_04025 [Chloroflexota bacterium]